MMRKGLIFIVSAPSGAGKTSLCRKVINSMPNIRHSVSYTTRTKRSGETDGVDYHFVSSEIFQRMIDENRFVEWAHVHGNRYGTSEETLRKYEDEGIDVILDIDVQGAEQIKRRLGKGVYIFILTPSPDELEQRLRHRGTDREEDISRRLKNAMDEVGSIEKYDYIIVNDVFDDAAERLRSIIVSERSRKESTLPQIRTAWGI